MSFKLIGKILLLARKCHYIFNKLSLKLFYSSLSNFGSIIAINNWHNLRNNVDSNGCKASHNNEMDNFVKIPCNSRSRNACSSDGQYLSINITYTNKECTLKWPKIVYIGSTTNLKVKCRVHSNVFIIKKSKVSTAFGTSEKLLPKIVNYRRVYCI